MGDFNVNTLDKSHYLYDDLIDLISVHNLHQFVNQPTYHKPNIVPSLLDHHIMSTVLIQIWSLRLITSPPASPPSVHGTILCFTA